MIRDVVTALVASLVLGLAVGGGFAAYDWRLNPGGIFRGPDGTNWQFMFETSFSWFLPIAVTAFPVLLAILWIYRYFKGRHEARQAADRAPHASTNEHLNE